MTILAFLLIALSMSTTGVHTPTSSAPTLAQSTSTAPEFSIWSPAVGSGNIANPNFLPGYTFELSVNISNAPLYDSYSFNLKFNPSVIQLVNTTLKGTVFYHHILYQSVFNYTSAPGMLNVVVRGDVVAQGNGTLVNTNFEVLGTSLSNLRVTDSLLAYQGVQIPHSESGGCFNNRPIPIQQANFTLDSSPGYSDTSSYLLGKIAVGIILPNGPYYKWTDAQVNQTISGIRAALNWWASRDPGANLTFYYDTHIRVPTSYEPIRMPLAQDTVWITDVMNHLGYTGGAFDATRAYDNAIRNANNTDWSYTIFVVDSDPGINLGRFTDFEYAHALIGGPWLTMSRLSPWAYNSANYFTAVPAHETGHIFGATDEYDTALEYSGYLFTPDADGSPGIMDHNTLTVSMSTEAQVGHVDCNGDRVPDLLQARPAVEVDSPPAVITSPITTITGKAMATPYPTYRPGGRAITIGKISSVKYSVDQGPWADTLLTGASFKDTLRDFTFNLTGLSGGSHVIQVRATNSVGVTQTNAFTVTVAIELGTPSFLRWRATAQDHNLNLTKVSAQVLKADVEVSGAPAYVYVQYRLVSNTGLVFIILSPITRIGAGNSTIIQTSWTPPPTQGRYEAIATIYYAAWAAQPGSAPWTVGETTQFVFRVTT